MGSQHQLQVPTQTAEHTALALLSSLQKLHLLTVLQAALHRSCKACSSSSSTLSLTPHSCSMQWVSPVPALALVAAAAAAECALDDVEHHRHNQHQEHQLQHTQQHETVMSKLASRKGCVGGECSRHDQTS